MTLNDIFKTLKTQFAPKDYYVPKPPTLHKVYKEDKEDKEIGINEVFKALGSLIPRYKTMKFKVKVRNGSINKVKLVKSGPSKYKLKIKVNPHQIKGLNKAFYDALYKMIPKNGHNKVLYKSVYKMIPKEKLAISPSMVMQGLYDERTPKTDRIAFVMRGVFRKMGLMDDEKVDVNKIYSKLNEIMPADTSSIKDALYLAIKKYEKQNLEQMEIFKALLKMNQEVEEETNKKNLMLKGLGQLVQNVDEEAKKKLMLGAVGQLVQNVNEEAKKKQMLGAVGQLVEDVKKKVDIFEKKENEENEDISQEETRLLIDAYKRMKKDSLLNQDK